MNQHRGFDSPFAPFSSLHCVGSTSFVSWNADGLRAFDPAKRVKKIEYAISVAVKFHVVALQETHCCAIDLKRLFGRLASSHHVVGSNDMVNGGIAFLIKNEWASGTVPRFVEVVPGRVGFVEVDGDSSCVRIVNVHNFGLGAYDFLQIKELLDDTLLRYRSDPCKFVGHLCGDMNYMDGGCESFCIGNPDMSVVRGGSREGQAQFERILGGWTELKAPGRSYSHFCNALLVGTLLDRHFTALPGWAVLHSGFQTAIVDDAHFLFNSGTSDHAPCVVTAGHGTVKSGSKSPISP